MPNKHMSSYWLSAALQNSRKCERYSRKSLTTDLTQSA